MAELPADLITKIMELSPAKTLLRFRCICKSIKEMIDSRDFIRWHLNTTTDHRTHNKMICVERKSVGKIANFLVYNVDDGSKQVFDINYGLIRPELRYICSGLFFAHCNGLVLLGEKDVYSLAVWNPTTMKYKRLPSPPRLEGSSYSEYINGLGFGYDSCSDDYKILLIKHIFYSEDDITKCELEIWILGLRSCYWRKFENFPHDLIYRLPQSVSNCFVDGAFHFSNRDGVVIAFDVAKETFSQVTLPPDIGHTEYCAYHLQVFEGCLCIIFEGLYVRRKDGVEFSWTKLLSITADINFFNIPRESIEGLEGYRMYTEEWGLRELYRCYEEGDKILILGYSKEGDKILILGTQQVLLYSYDLKEKSLRSVLDGDIYHYPNVIFCIESLVPVDYQE